MTIAPHPFTGLAIEQSIFQLGAQRVSEASAAASGASLASFLGPAGAVAGGLFSVFGTIGRNKALAESAKMNIEDRQRIITEARVQRFMESDRLANEVGQVHGRARVALGMIRGTNAEVLANIAMGAGRSQLAINKQTENTVTEARQQQKFIAAAANSQMQNPVISLITGSLSGFMMGSQVQNLLTKKEQMNQAVDYAAERHRLMGATSVLESLAKAIEAEGLNDRMTWSGQATQQVDTQSRSLLNMTTQAHQAMFEPASQTNPAVVFKSLWGTFGRGIGR